MRRLGVATVLAAVLLVGCASTDGPTDQQPRRPDHTPAVGFHSVAYHGISVDVPDTARLTMPSPCGFGLPTDGDLVVSLFDAGATSCPALPAPTPTPRPATALTVVLAAAPAAPDLTLPDPRTRDLDGATVTASGPAAEVEAVLASARVTPVDDHGCVEQIDPSVAPSNTASADGALLPATPSRIVVCEYGQTGTGASTGDAGPPGPFWLVASDRLSDPDAESAARRIQRGTTPADRSGRVAPFGGVVRYLVLGGDGSTRTLQTTVDTSPQLVTDGHRTVAVDALVDGFFDPLPTPFG